MLRHPDEVPVTLLMKEATLKKIYIAFATVALSTFNFTAMAQDSGLDASDRTKSHHHQIYIGLPLTPDDSSSSEITQLDEGGKLARFKKVGSSAELLRVFDANGKPLTLTKADRPLNAKRIVSVKTITVMDIEGSHYLDITIDGVPYKVMLPD